MESEIVQVVRCGRQVWEVWEDMGGWCKQCLEDKTEKVWGVGCCVGQV